MKAMMGQIDKVEKFKTTFSRKVNLPGVPKMLGEVCPSPKRTFFGGHLECLPNKDIYPTKCYVCLFKL